jgi:transposase
MTWSFHQGATLGPYDIFSGLDVDKTSITVTYADSQQILRTLRVPYEASHLIAYVRKHFADKRVIFAYEAGPTGYGLYDGLTAAGFPCLIAPAALIPVAPGKRVKNNRLDSKKIAIALRNGELQSIYVPSPRYRHLRHLTKQRDVLVRQITATKLRIKSLFLFEGMAFPQGQWSRRGIGQLQRLPCSEAVRFRLDSLLAALEFHQGQLLQTMRALRRFCRQEEELWRCLGYLRSLPGIGLIVGTALLARIGDWRQLEDHHVSQLGSFLGLVPTEHSTGDQVHRGSINRAGDRRLRSKLIQSAWAAIRKDPELLEFYRSVYRRHAPDQAARKAIVAVARKLTTRIFAVLKEQRPYVVRPSLPSQPLTAEEIRPRESLDAPQK